MAWWLVKHRDNFTFTFIMDDSKQVLLEKKTVAQLIKKFSAFYETQ
jgi:hypothetical protein